MILDFTTRQTGKSTRLAIVCVDYVLAHPHQYANIVCASHRTCQNITDKLLIYLSGLGYDRKQAAALIRSKINVGIYLDRSRRNFVDDCEHVPANRLYFIDPNGYYTATTEGRDGLVTDYVQSLVRYRRNQRINSVLS